MRSFCSAKAPHIFSAKNISTLDFRRTRRLNESLTDDFIKLTMFWTTGPWWLLNLNTAFDASNRHSATKCTKFFKPNLSVQQISCNILSGMCWNISLKWAYVKRTLQIKGTVCEPRKKHLNLQCLLIRHHRQDLNLFLRLSPFELKT